MALTQARSAGAFTGTRYGSFAAKGGGEHPVDVLTQPRSHAGFTGGRYGSFAGRGIAGHPVGTLTQPRAHAAFTGLRYGDFSGRSPAAPPPQLEAGEKSSGLTPRRRVRRSPLPSPLEEFDAAEEEIELRLLGVLH